MISEIYQKKFSQSGYEVFLANSGEQALNLINKEKVDVILTDLIMPKIDGFEVIKNSRSSSLNSGVKIIVSSNLGQKENRDKALEAGADEFVVKSEYTPGDLIKEVDRIINTTEEEKKNEARRSGMSPSIEEKDKKKILLIEDEDVFIEMFGKKLKEDGYSVEVAENGTWGVKKAMEKKFDIFIIDMIMPAMTGDEIVAKLKMEEETKNIPIICLSASVDGEIEKKVLDMGADYFFLKTRIIPSELSKRVAELLNKK